MTLAVALSANRRWQREVRKDRVSLENLRKKKGYYFEDANNNESR